MKLFKKNRYWILSGLVVVIFGAVVRLLQLGKVPVSLYWDEMAMLVDAKSIAATGRDMYGNSAWQSMFVSYGDYKLPVYIWLTSFAVALFSPQEWVVRLPSALVGIAQIGVIALLIRELLTVFSHKVSSRVKQRWMMLMSMIVLASSPWAILFSRTGFEGHVGQFLVSCAVLFLLYSRRDPRWLLVSSATAALAVYTYYSVRFVWPVVYGAYFLSLASFHVRSKGDVDWRKFVTTNRGTIARSLLLAVGGVLLWIALLLPLYRSPYYAASQQYRLSATSVLNTVDYPLQSNILREQAGNGLFARVIYHRYVLLGRELLVNYAQHLRPQYIFLLGDSNLRHGTLQSGLFVLALLPIGIIGLFRMWADHPEMLLFVIIWWLIALLPASVPEEVPHALRSLNALTPMTLLFGYGGATVLIAALRRSSLIFRSTALLVGVVALIQTCLFVMDYFTAYPLRSASDWQTGYHELADYVHGVDESYTHVLVAIGDQRFYLWMLAHPAISASSLSSLPYQSYTLSSLGTVTFDNAIPTATETLEDTLIVTKYAELPEYVQPIDTVYDSLAVPRFSAGVVKDGVSAL